MAVDFREFITVLKAFHTLSQDNIWQVNCGRICLADHHSWLTEFLLEKANMDEMVMSICEEFRMIGLHYNQSL